MPLYAKKSPLSLKGILSPQTVMRNLHRQDTKKTSLQ